MNLQLHHVISDIAGQTGLAIVDAILAGQQDPQKLAKLRNERIQASEEVIAKSLVGDYRPEHLFTLRQSLAAYRSYQKLLRRLRPGDRSAPEAFQSPGHASQSLRRTPKPSAQETASVRRQHLAQLNSNVFSASTLTKIPGFAAALRKRCLEKSAPISRNFPAPPISLPGWRCVPDNDISGGKVLWVGTRKVKCRAATALRMAAQSLHHSKSALGDFYRRMRSKLGASQGHYRRRSQTGAHHLSFGHHRSGIRRREVCRRSTPLSETPGIQTPRQGQIHGLSTRSRRTRRMSSLGAGWLGDY